MNWTWPLITNGAHLVSARDPGGSFPVHHPHEAVPELTNDNLFPSLGLPPFTAHKNQGPAGDTIFQNPMCASVNNLFAMMSNTESICTWLIRRIHRLVYFWFCISIYSIFFKSASIYHLDLCTFDSSLILKVRCLILLFNSWYSYCVNNWWTLWLLIEYFYVYIVESSSYTKSPSNTDSAHTQSPYHCEALH